MQLVAYGAHDVYVFGNNYDLQYDVNNFNKHRSSRERFFYKYKKNHIVKSNNLNKGKQRQKQIQIQRESGYVFNENKNKNYQPILLHNPNEFELRRVKQSKNTQPNKIKKTIHWRILANLGGFIKKKSVNDLVLGKYFINPNNRLHYNKFILIDKIKTVLYNIQTKKKLVEQLKNYFNKFINVSLFGKEKPFQQHFFSNIAIQLKIKQYIINNFNFDQTSYLFNLTNKNIMKNTECPISTEEITEKYIECKNCLYCYDYETCKIWLEQRHNCPMCNKYLEETCKYINNTYCINVNEINLCNTIETLIYVKNKIKL